MHAALKCQFTFDHSVVKKQWQQLKKRTKSDRLVIELQMNDSDDSETTFVIWHFEAVAKMPICWPQWRNAKPHRRFNYSCIRTPYSTMQHDPRMEWLSHIASPSCRGSQLSRAHKINEFDGATPAFFSFIGIYSVLFFPHSLEILQIKIHPMKYSYSWTESMSGPSHQILLSRSVACSLHLIWRQAASNPSRCLPDRFRLLCDHCRCSSALIAADLDCRLQPSLLLRRWLCNLTCTSLACFCSILLQFVPFPAMLVEGLNPLRRSFEKCKQRRKKKNILKYSDYTCLVDLNFTVCIKIPVETKWTLSVTLWNMHV